MYYFRDFLASILYLLKGTREDKTSLIRAIEAAVHETRLLKNHNIDLANPYDIPNENCVRVRDAWANVIDEVGKLKEAIVDVELFEGKHEFWSNRDLRQMIGDGEDVERIPAHLREIEELVFKLKTK